MASGGSLTSFEYAMQVDKDTHAPSGDIRSIYRFRPNEKTVSYVDAMVIKHIQQKFI